MTRLEPWLSASKRTALARTLAGRVVRAGRSAGMDVRVVSRDPAVREWAVEQDATVVDDPGTGLNDAAAAGTATAAGPWIVTHADLPLVTPEALASLSSAASGGMALVPSLDGGTNAIAGHGSIGFRFGVGSFHRHLAEHPRAAVVSTPSLAVDIDTVTHLRALRTVDPDLALTADG